MSATVVGQVCCEVKEHTSTWTLSLMNVHRFHSKIFEKKKLWVQSKHNNNHIVAASCHFFWAHCEKIQSEIQHNSPRQGIMVHPMMMMSPKRNKQSVLSLFCSLGCHPARLPFLLAGLLGEQLGSEAPPPLWPASNSRAIAIYVEWQKGICQQIPRLLNSRLLSLTFSHRPHKVSAFGRRYL